MAAALELVLPALIRALAGVLPWVLAWFALGGNTTSVEKNIEGFGQAITQGPVNTATNAYVKVAVIGASLAFAIWGAEAYIGSKRGEFVPTPVTHEIPLATPPVFGTAGGYGFTGGPFTTGASVQSGGGAPQYFARPAPPPRGGTTFAPRRARPAQPRMARRAS